ncbi:glucoamylase family protein [Chitinophaga caseinilytica]|uniref:glucoamylase family protein n=1 Tax=Chitinophaga caseinilytica TaxID=2267521 RepID=UPI003C302C45
MKMNIRCVLIVFAAMFAPLAMSAQQKKKIPRQQLGDTALVTLVQQRTFNYFWKFAHPVSGLAPERTTTPDTVTIGGSGFGVMAILVGIERKFITRDEGLDRMLKIVNFLLKADHYHGIWPHWMHGATGKTVPFSRRDDGGDLVESAFMWQGLLCVRQYFDRDVPKERELRDKIGWMWSEAEWSWYTQGGQDVLYWHWSPNQGWAMNHAVRGYNECLIAYVLAASSPTYPVSPRVYHQGWAVNNHFLNGRQFYGITLPLGFPYGGPLFFAHYSFLGLDPRGLKDQYADYWEQNKAHTLINRQYCIDNPKQFKGYGPDCWGLTASDNHEFYNAHSPTNDLGVITPTAALSSFPYTPEYSMQAMRYFYDKLGDRLWGEYGFYDAFNETVNWFDYQYLAIDQGPIVVMIENYRSGLLWRLFMSCPEVKTGLRRLGFSSPSL